MTRHQRVAPALVVATLALLSLLSSRVLAQDIQWRVARASGEVWLLAGGAQPVSLGGDAVLKPGDSVRTGKTGRLMLIKGEETMLLSPNTAITVPESTPDGLRTNVQQQSGAITITAEKRGQNHFQVDTPYLAAVVKGTQFTVTVDGGSARVAVREGRVEVSDYRSGQIALVLPAQTALAVASGGAGLRLSGSGPFNPMIQGVPRAAPVAPLAVPRGGLTPSIAPAPGLQNRQQNATLGVDTRSGATRLAPAPTATRIAAPIGQVTLDIGTAAGRLARGSAPVAVAPTGQTPAAVRAASRSGKGNDTVWSNPNGMTGSSAAQAAAAASSNSGGTAAVAVATGASGVTASSGKGSSASASTSTSASAAVLVDDVGRVISSGQGSSNSGNGNSGNGNSGNGNSGNGNSGNGNSGNGNGSNNVSASANTGNSGNISVNVGFGNGLLISAGKGSGKDK